MKVGLITFWGIDELWEKGDGLWAIDDDEESFLGRVGAGVRRLSV